MKRLIHLLPGMALILALLSGLEAAARSGLVNAAILPAPSQIAGVLWTILASGQFLTPLAQTLELLAISYGLACLAGVILGALMGYYRVVYYLFEPLVEQIGRAHV